MYWNVNMGEFTVKPFEININMRCIEIMLAPFRRLRYNRLTLTWDVLKSNPAATRIKDFFWLTLTWDVLKWRGIHLLLAKEKGLTLTWDVLKSWQIRKSSTLQKRLTLTWDVLKFLKYFWRVWCFLININMRCIEMFLELAPQNYSRWLTLTWDVLKSSRQT